MTMIGLLVAVQSAILSPPMPEDRRSVAIGQATPAAAGAAARGVDTRVPQIARPASSASKATTDPVIGRDRCETRATASETLCRDAIEGQAARFAPVDPNPLTRDQRAIAERRLVDPRSDPMTVSQRVARGDLDPAAPLAQGVAAAAASGRTTPPDVYDAGLTDLQQAIMSGVIVPGDVAQPPASK